MMSELPKILIVEDDVSSQQYYSIILEGMFEIHIVDSVLAAKKALAKNVFVLALVDISLPGAENGIDLITYFINEFESDLPAIAITAHAFPQNRKVALEAGAVAFFTKPILSNALIEACEEHKLSS